MQNKCRATLPAVWALLPALLVVSRVEAESYADGLRLRQSAGGVSSRSGAGARGPEYNDETTIVEVDTPLGDPGSRKTEHMDVTVEMIFAILYVAIIGSVPILFSQLEPEGKMGWVALAQVCALVIWLVGGLVLLTNVILFQSIHWEGHRPLTIVETVYLLSQIITTVGYGDITPAKQRGQVVIALYIIMALLVIANMVSEVSSKVVNTVQTVTAKTQKDPLGTQAMQKAARFRDEEGDDDNDTEAPDEPEVTVPRVSEGAGLPIPGLHNPSGGQFTDLKLYHKPKIEYTRLIVAFITFIVFAGAGVMFYHWYPGEEKTWLQAVYMSVITLSTVGFGAFNASSEAGKVFGAFWMLFGVAALVNFVTAFTEVTLKMKEIEKWDQHAVAQEMKENLDKVLKKDEQIINRQQFIKFALLQCKLATETQLAMIEKEWSRLKPDRDGFIRTDVFYDQLQHIK